MNSSRISKAIRYAAFAAAACLMVPAGTGTLAGFFGRHGWLCELASHFRVQYFWLLVIATALLALARWRRWSLASATLATVNLALIVPLYFGPARQDTSGPTLRALSQNVLHANRQFERVLELIRTERPDFMLLLEVTPGWIAAMEGFRDDYPYQRAIPSPGSSGIAFYSRIQAAELETRIVGDMPVIVAHLVSPAGPLTVIGVHPASPRRNDELEARNRSLAALADFAIRTQGPLVVMGDLNTTSWSPYFQDLIGDSGLIDSRRGFGVCATWPGLPMPGRIPIDHCLVSPGVTVVDRRIGPAVGSDHRAILIDLTLPRP